MGLSVVIKDLLEAVIQSTDDFVQTDVNWFTDNSKHIYPIIGISEYVIDYIGKNADNIPAIVALQPFIESKGGDFTEVKIPRIIIVAEYDRKDNLIDREDVTVNPVLYPAYEAFLQMLVQHPNVIDSDWTSVIHKMAVIPGWQPADNRLEKYFDAIELTDLIIKIYKPLNC